MDDTSVEVKALMRQKLMGLSGEERFIRGTLMFDAAREMVVASLEPGLTGGELRRKLYQRIYGEPLETPDD
jgi:hypothetical protein